MFDNLNNKESEKVDDIFADSDRIEDEASFSTQNNAPFSKAMPNVDLPGIKQQVDQISAKEAASLADFDNEPRSNVGGKIIKKMLITILILAIIALLAYIVYAKILVPRTLNQVPNSENNSINLNLDNKTGNDFNFDSSSEDATSSINLIEEDDFIIEDLMINSTTTNDDALTENSDNLLKEMDSDYDGLSDYDEIYVYNTDPNNHDSDGDGLSDYDEIFIFGTNPLNVDSDADGYPDGLEIESGFSPLGEGRLKLDQIKDITLFSERFPAIYQKIVQ